jgi:hypothetical protein
MHGIDNPEIEFDESFYTFDTKQLSKHQTKSKREEIGCENNLKNVAIKKLVRYHLTH